MVIFDGKIFLYLIKHGKINSVSQYFPNDQSMMLQNLKLLKVCLKYQLGQILQLTFKKLSLKKKKKLSLIKFWYNIKEEPQLSEKMKKTPLSTTYLYKAWFSLYMSAKTTHHNRFYTEVEEKIPAVLS